MTDLYKDSIPTGVNGQGTVGTTSAFLSPVNHKLLSGVIVKALSDNAGTVYVGFGDVTTATGFPLSAGDSVPLNIEELHKVKIIASEASQGFAFLGQ
jgi:hypothetical protein